MAHSATIFDTDGNPAIRIISINEGDVRDLATIEFLIHDNGKRIVTTKQAREIIENLMKCYFNESYSIPSDQEISNV